MSDVERYQVLRPLGADQATFVARDTTSSAARYVVLERVTRASPVPAARAQLLRRGRALVALEHPKVVRVRDVFERDGEVLVVSDYVDGEWLSALMMMTPRPPLEVLLRLVLDVLEGLSALHDLEDERGQSLGFVHGALGPDTVLVAEDGVAEIARACRLPRPGGNERYVAPELRRGDGPIDVRCDIYAAGAILRDMLVDAPPGAAWAEPLTDIAWRACSVEPEDRWPSAAAMATTVRRIAGSKLATAEAVADLVRSRFGATMQSRRADLELADGAPPSSEPLSVKSSDMEVIEPATLAEPMAPSARKEIARITLTKRPASLVLTEQPPEPPPAESGKRAGTVTQQGMPVAPVPVVVVAPVAASVEPPAQEPSLPPPTVLVPDVEPTHPPPPPTIVPEEDQVRTEAYRRQMPTFPTFDVAAPPPRRSVALQGMAIATAMVVTFGIGWWGGRNYAPPVQAPETEHAGPPAASGWGTAAAAATAPGTETAPETLAASATASEAATTATTTTATASTLSTGTSTAPAPPASAAVTQATATQATATQPTAAQPTVRAPATARTPPAGWSPPPRPTAVSTAAPTQAPTGAAPTAAAPTTAPTPATTGGYVPSEL
jgi:hypothetical protein